MREMGCAVENETRQETGFEAELQETEPLVHIYMHSGAPLQRLKKRHRNLTSWNERTMGEWAHLKDIYFRHRANTC